MEQINLPCICLDKFSLHHVCTKEALNNTLHFHLSQSILCSIMFVWYGSADSYMGLTHDGNEIMVF